jgi:hypothetical protein
MNRFPVDPNDPQLSDESLPDFWTFVSWAPDRLPPEYPRLKDARGITQQDHRKLKTTP